MKAQRTVQFLTPKVPPNFLIKCFSLLAIQILDAYYCSDSDHSQDFFDRKVDIFKPQTNWSQMSG